MDLSPVADIFDCVTAVGDTERFLASLTASPPVNFTFSSHPDDFNALPFDMPLAHALATSEPAPALLPNPPPPHPDTHKPHFHHIRPSHSPVSALTGATVASPPPPDRSKRRISKKKAAHHHHPHPAHTVAAIAASLATHNMSAVSDVTYPHSPPISSPKSSSVSNLSSPTSLQLAVGLSASLPSPHPAPTRPANKPTTQPSTPQHPSSASPVSNNRDTPAEPPKSHTRRCREKVTRQFEHLLEVLPPPSRGVEVRHKAQILDYTINVFRSLLARRTFLHTHIALASNDTLLQWVNATLLRASSTLKPDSLPHSLSIASLLDPFMSLYCVKHSWSYAEAWVLTPDTKHAALNSYVVNSEDSKVSANLEVFAAASKARYGAASEIVSGVVSRARQTKHPEWLIDLSHDQSVFDRAELAAKHAIQIALAVPVVAENMCLAVLVFAHSTHRTFSAAEVDQLFGFASVLGKRFVRYSRGCVLQIQQQQQQQHEQQHHHHHHQQRQHQQQQPKQEQQHQVIPMSPDASSIINPGVSVDATSAVGVFEALPTPLPVAAPTWTIPAPMLLPQLSEASSKSLFEDTKLLSENVLKSC